MTDYTQSLINNLNHDTVEGFAEALLICIKSLTNEKGLFVNVTIGDTIEQEIYFAQKIAVRMLEARDQ